MNFKRTKRCLIPEISNGCRFHILPIPKLCLSVNCSLVLRRIPVEQLVRRDKTPDSLYKLGGVPVKEKTDGTAFPVGDRVASK